MTATKGPPRDAPGPQNGWSSEHVELLLASHRRLTGRVLFDAPVSGLAVAQAVFDADFALLSHGLEADPLFNYANRTALALFELDWPTLIETPSRASAEALAQADRARLMQRVLEQGFIEDYSGVRIARSGRRFIIERATVWNVIDAQGTLHGQAASFTHWREM